jgi:hypothetical protein
MAGTYGYFGAMLMSTLIDYILTWSHQSYNLVFALAGVLYLVAISVMQFIAPSFDEVRLPMASPAR